jgi:hypothetical protein
MNKQHISEQIQISESERDQTDLNVLMMLTFGSGQSAHDIRDELFHGK